MNPTGAQVSGAASMSIASAVTWLVTFILGKIAKIANAGWLLESDVPQLGMVLVVLGFAAWGYYANRPTAILQAAGKVVGEDGKKTVVIASPELSDAIPAANVVSNATNKVVTK